MGLSPGVLPPTRKSRPSFDGGYQTGRLVVLDRSHKPGGRTLAEVRNNGGPLLAINAISVVCRKLSTTLHEWEEFCEYHHTSTDFS
jgi:hypothetical protein